MSDVGRILSEQGVPNAIKLDDVLVWGHSYSNCLAIIQHEVELFQYFSFGINFRKLTVIPSHTIEYLGVLLDSFNACFSLTEAKRTKPLPFLSVLDKINSILVHLLNHLIGFLILFSSLFLIF